MLGEREVCKNGFGASGVVFAVGAGRMMGVPDVQGCWAWRAGFDGFLGRLVLMPLIVAAAESGGQAGEGGSAGSGSGPFFQYRATPKGGTFWAPGFLSKLSDPVSDTRVTDAVWPLATFHRTASSHGGGCCWLTVRTMISRAMIQRGRRRCSRSGFKAGRAKGRIIGRCSRCTVTSRIFC